jgi:hypothetical protein
MRPERSWKRAARDAWPVIGALAVCPVVAALAGGPAEPLARARALIGAERSLGLFFEPHVYGWVAARPWLMGLANIAYVAFHLPVMLGVLAWVWAARPGAFRLARNTFVAAQALIVAGYLLVPTAPPRMVASLGYDSAAGITATRLDRLVLSPYAAMPSGHAAFSLIAAGIVLCLSRNRLVRAAAALYPVVVLLEIVATGNHIWLDAAAGAVAAGLGLTQALALGGASAWRPAREPIGEGAPG